MNLGRVIGQATSTVKHPSLDGWRLLVIQPVNNAGEPDGEPVMSIDDMGAGRGDMVLISSDGKAVREMMKSNNTPVRWAVMGLQD